MTKQLTGSLYLVIAVLIWGSTFVAQSMGMDKIGPFTFQTSRCALAILFLIPVIALFEIGSIKDYWKKWLNRDLWKAGILCGIALFIAASLQQVSLVDTDAGKAGFLTALYVVLVPVIGVFLGQKLKVNVAISIILAVFGLYMLSSMSLGYIVIEDIMLIGCALCFAVQITLVDRLGSKLDGLRLNFIQCFVAGTLSALCMIFMEEPVMAEIVDCWLPISYAGVLSMGVAYSLQVLGQQRIEPTTASIIMSMESVVAALSGWLILHETMSTRELFGCALVFAAVILSQISFKNHKPQ